jgi:Polyketide cyclase / dehydrase and lipid transport
MTTRRIGRAERTLTQEIVDNHPPRTWSARGVDGPIRPTATLTIEPLGSGARIRLALDYEGYGLGRALLPLVRRQTRAGAPVSLANLKKRRPDESII